MKNSILQPKAAKARVQIMIETTGMQTPRTQKLTNADLTGNSVSFHVNQNELNSRSSPTSTKKSLSVKFEEDLPKPHKAVPPLNALTNPKTSDKELKRFAFGSIEPKRQILSARTHKMDFQTYATQMNKMKHDYSTPALLTKESDPKLPETPLG